MDVSQYLEIFIDETSEHIQSLNDCIMTLEKEPENKDTINEIFRAAHSLKGMAGTMGFKRMQHLTHDMENVFQEVRSDKVKVTSEMIDILFQCLDAIESYLDTIKSTSGQRDCYCGCQAGAAAFAPVGLPAGVRNRQCRHGI